MANLPQSFAIRSRIFSLDEILAKRCDYLKRYMCRRRLRWLRSSMLLLGVKLGRARQGAATLRLGDFIHLTWM